MDHARHPFETGLDRSAANYAPLTPASFLAGAAASYGAKTAVIDGDRRIDYATLYARCRRLASGLQRRGVGRLDTVAILAPNTPEMIEAHFAVPMLGGVLNPLNTRLDAATLAFSLDHGLAKVLIVDRDVFALAEEALTKTKRRPIVVTIGVERDGAALHLSPPGREPAPGSIGGRPAGPGEGASTFPDDREPPHPLGFADRPLPAGERWGAAPVSGDEAQAGQDVGFGRLSYEALLAEGDPDFDWSPPEDEWQSLGLLYTSGTTGDPKGVVSSHRGAYLQALGNAVTFGLSGDSVYLWTLPMFHCNGWSYPWAVVAVGGAQVCMRKVEPAKIFRLIAKHRVTHLCGAPIVLSMIANAPAADRVAFDHVVRCATGGAAPSSTVLRAMEDLGFRVTHLYGATECYGPGTVRLAQPDWAELPVEARYTLMARQGVALATLDAVMVADPETAAPAPKDRETVGEIMMRGNTVMKGYFANPAATAQTLGGGWYRSGDLAVWGPDGAIEIKDRSKDIIISGGENISSLEVEEVLAQHPAVMLAAVVARPDDKWGETPCAFLELKPGAAASDDEVIAFCLSRMARFKAPRSVVFGPLPKTSTGKIQKFILREQARSL